MIAGLGVLIVQGLVMSAAGAVGDMAVRTFWSNLFADEERQKQVQPIAVKLLQATLNVLGASLVVDGQYGPATKDAVEAFQKTAGIRVDGIAGDRTLDAIVRALQEVKK